MSTCKCLPHRTLNLCSCPMLHPNICFNTSFNSPLEWDLVNVTSVQGMLGFTPVNKPIIFQNTQNVTQISGLFYYARQFNQPFHFDSPSLVAASLTFSGASAFNQIVNLTDTRKLVNISRMFQNADSFNQPLNFDTQSVQFMDEMFQNATKFNHPVNFNVSKVLNANETFEGATAFNQPINFNFQASQTNVSRMFANALSFNQPVVMNTTNVYSTSQMFANAENFASTVNFTSTANVTDMSGMFDGVVGFDQDLSRWNTSRVRKCSRFCPWCGLPAFASCSPCSPIYISDDDDRNLSVCTNGTRSPTRAPKMAPSSSAASSSAVSAAPSLLGEAATPNAVLAAGMMALWSWV